MVPAQALVICGEQSLSGNCWWLKDRPAGRKLYRAYLEWLCEEDSERKRLGFEKMSSGWAKGTQEFKKAILNAHKDDDLKKIVKSEAA